MLGKPDSNPTDLTANFLPSDPGTSASRQTYVMAGIFAVVVAIAATLGAGASYRAVTHGTNVFSEVGNLPIISDIRRAVLPSAGEEGTSPIAKDDKLKILFLGIGGDGHEGSQLTDTIILTSIDFKEKKAGMLSLPRDLAYPLGGGRFEKINSINAYAELEHPGEGAVRTGQAISKLLDVEIDHVVRVDFRGFSEFVDAIGGIDVTVERSFTDPQYPTYDDKWTTVSFKKGVQHMDGKTALTFARSRHGNNGEGSDFARSKRQQLVIMAIREKLLSLNTLGNPKKLAALYATVSRNIQTDLSIWDLVELANKAKDFSKDQVTTRVLTDAQNGELVPSTVNGAFMLFPRKPDWSAIRAIAQNPYQTAEQEVAAARPVETIKIEIKNGTSRTGFASQAAAKLEKMGYEITAFGNAGKKGYERSVIFDLTNGKKRAELLKLKNVLDAEISLSAPVPGDAETTKIVYGNDLTPERILSFSSDFLVILGDGTAAFLEQQTAQATP